MAEDIEGLADLLTVAARKAFGRLFRDYPEQYYYCALLTTGAAHCPAVTAWSKETLAEEVAKRQLHCDSDLKWNGIESPRYIYAEEEFDAVRRVFLDRTSLVSNATSGERLEEYRLRLGDGFRDVDIVG